MKIINETRGTLLASNCEVADTFWTRFLGLMGRDRLDKGAGLIITPCNSIHMFFMRFPLDIVFIDRSNTVVHVIDGIKPWKVSGIIKKAHSAIELPVGTVKKTRTSTGDKLCIKRTLYKVF